MNFTNILFELEKLQSAERFELSKTYYPTQAIVLGVSNPDIQTILKSLNTYSKKLTDTQKIDLMFELINSNIFECILLAYQFLRANKLLIKQLTKNQIIDLAAYQDNWVLVDTYSVYVLAYGIYFEIIDKKYILNLQLSHDLWQRRTAIVTTVGLNLKSNKCKVDADFTIEICKNAISEKHKMIYKALSWALRELSKSNKQIVEEFISLYSSHIHKSALKEIRSKLDTGRKN